MCVCVCVCVCIVLSNLYFGMHTCPFGRSFLGLVDRYFGVGIYAIVFRHIAVCLFGFAKNTPAPYLYTSLMFLVWVQVHYCIVCACVRVRVCMCVCVHMSVCFCV